MSIDLASSLTKNNLDDGSEVSNILNKIDGNISLFLGYGAYDNEPVHNFLEDKYPGIKIVTQPRKEAVFSSAVDTAPTQRDKHFKKVAPAGEIKADTANET